MGNLINQGMYTSATEEWETPEKFFKALDAWFHDHVLPEADVYFIRGRIRFSGNKSNAPFPSMIAVFDGRPRLTGWECHMEAKIQGTPEEIHQKIKKALGE